MLLALLQITPAELRKCRSYQKKCGRSQTSLTRWETRPRQLPKDTQSLQQGSPPRFCSPHTRRKSLTSPRALSHLTLAILPSSRDSLSEDYSHIYFLHSRWGLWARPDTQLLRRSAASSKKFPG